MEFNYFPGLSLSNSFQIFAIMENISQMVFHQILVSRKQISDDLTSDVKAKRIANFHVNSFKEHFLWQSMVIKNWRIFLTSHINANFVWDGKTCWDYWNLLELEPDGKLKRQRGIYLRSLIPCISAVILCIWTSICLSPSPFLTAKSLSCLVPQEGIRQ